MTAYATIEGELIQRLVIHVPASGAWFADVDLFDDRDLSGRVTITVGGTSFVGTVVEDSSGSFQGARKLRVVAGGAGWGKLLQSKHYHSDAGILARSVAEDAAREAGETLGSTFRPARDRVGVDYVRSVGTASRALEDATGVPWWLDYDGRTHVGPRPSSTPQVDVYEVLEFDPRAKVATIALDDVSVIVPGSELHSPRLDAPLVVREAEIEIADSARMIVRVGPDMGRAARALASFIQRETDSKLFGKFKYRVVSMKGDRVELQAVDRSRGLPDISPISMWPGSPGLHAVLSAGQELLVEFIDGNRTEPIITHFAGKDGRSWTPTELILAADSSVKIGSENPTEKAAIASKVEEKLDAIASALDAFVSAAPVSQDGGAAIQAAVTAVWGVGSTPPADVGSSKVLIDP